MVEERDRRVKKFGMFRQQAVEIDSQGLAGLFVAVEGAFGEEIAGHHRPGAFWPGASGSESGGRFTGRDGCFRERFDDGADDDGVAGEVGMELFDHLDRLDGRRHSGATEETDQPLALDGGEHVELEFARCAAECFDVEIRASARDGDGDAALRVPADRGSAGEHGFIRVRPHDGVDDGGFDA